MAYIRRHMEEPFLRLNREYAAILITGPRQVGKTTMLQKLMDREAHPRNYVTLDDANERMLARNDPAMFFQLHRPPVCIDEIQYAPGLFRQIKLMIDKDPHPGDFWMTGSQVFKLMEGVQESLAGRVALLHLSTLSQAEIRSPIPWKPFRPNLGELAERQKDTAAMDIHAVYERLFQGGMPALVSGRFTDRAQYYSDYIATYLERDVREISGTIDSLKFMRFVTAAAARAAQLLNFQSIAEDCDIAPATAKSWMSILEKLGIAYLLHPYANNVLKRTIKTPKLYFTDTGLVCWLTRWSSTETAMNGAMNGALLENHVVGEIMKGWQNAGVEPFLYYYRDKDMKEIDLLLESDGALFPVEIKRTATPERRLTKVFDVIEKSSLLRGTGAVICMAEQLGAFDSENLIVPVGLL